MSPSHAPETVGPFDYHDEPFRGSLGLLGLQSMPLFPAEMGDVDRRERIVAENRDPLTDRKIGEAAASAQRR